MNIQQIDLPAILAPYFTLCLDIRSEHFQKYVPQTFGFPEATPELIIILEGHLEVYYKDQYYFFEESGVFGCVDKPILLIPSNHIRMIKLTFHPVGVYSLFKITSLTAKELMSKPAFWTKDILGNDIQLLEEQLFEQTNPDEIKRLIVDYLWPKLNRVATNHRDEAILKLATTQNYSVDHLCEQWHCTPRTLQRWFAQHLGISPKYYLRLLRFKKILRDMTQEPSKDAISFVNDCGFYDQTHLIKEIKYFTDQTPKTLPIELYHLRQFG